MRGAGASKFPDKNLVSKSTGLKLSVATNTAHPFDLDSVVGFVIVKLQSTRSFQKLH